MYHSPPKNIKWFITEIGSEIHKRLQCKVHKYFFNVSRTWVEKCGIVDKTIKMPLSTIFQLYGVVYF
jgi:hypothetical protein